MRKSCKECPWKGTNSHSIKFRTYVEKMEKIGRNKHKCHMISSDVWGYKTPVNENNICVGNGKI